MNNDLTIITPPKNNKAECAVLGACLIDNSAIDQALAILKPEMFYPDAHKEMFRAITALHTERKPVDLVSISEFLERKNKLDLVGGRTYLATFEMHVLTTQNIGYYAGLVKGSWKRRELINVGRELIAQSNNADDDDGNDNGPSAAANRAQDSLRNLTIDKTKRGLVHISEIANREIDALEARSLGNIDPNPPLKTGLNAIDDVLVGFEREDLIVLGAATSKGKTALGLTILDSVINRLMPVAVFSMEMGEKSLYLRQLSIRTRDPIVPIRHLREGIRNRERFNHVLDVHTELIKKPMHLEFIPSLKPSQLASKCRAHLREVPNLALIIVDHLHEMDSDGPAGESDNAKFGRICKALKAMAGELGVPVLCLAQLNRSSDREKEREPELHDLRGSGGIEEAADVVMLIQRKRIEDVEIQDCNLIIAKNRHGETGKRQMLFVKKHARFTDVATEAQEELAYNAQGNLIG